MTIDIERAERIPVIIGVGQVNDRPEDPDKGLDSLGLMVAALRAAESDSGVDVLARIDSLAIVDQMSFMALGTLCKPLASAIGADPVINYQSDAPHGDTPIRLLNEAANLIGKGEVKLAAIVGGEALRTASGRAAKLKGSSGKGGGGEGGMRAALEAFGFGEPTFLQRHGLFLPTDIYPIYENATRAAWGQSLDEGQKESAAIWAQMSEVAVGNEGAWIRKAVSAEEILTPSESNRLLAWPYTKLMVANSSVNQGAGFIVASLAEARRLGIAEDRFVYVGMGASAKEPEEILERDRFDRSIAMETAILRTLDLNAMTGGDFDHVELYSCFPCIPKMARRTLCWPVDKPATVFGGLTFGGGPIANYMSHAVASMVEKLRGGDEKGFLFANGGFATDNHCIILSSKPIVTAAFPQDFDYQAEADGKRGTVPDLDEGYCGAATIETFTIFFDRAGAPKSGVVVARTAEGKRTLTHVDVADQKLLAMLTDGAVEPVGQQGRIEQRSDKDRFWTQ